MGIVKTSKDPSYYGTHSDTLDPFTAELPYGVGVDDSKSNIIYVPPSPYVQRYELPAGSFDEARQKVYDGAVSDSFYYDIGFFGEGFPQGHAYPRADYDKTDALPYDSASLFQGKPYICSYDYDPFQPGPFLQFMVDDNMCIACGTQACQDVKDYIIKHGQASQTTLPFEIPPTTVITGGPLIIYPKCFGAPLCWMACLFADNDGCSCIDPTECMPYKKHVYYTRIHIFSTFIYEYIMNGTPMVYESPPSRIVVTRTTGDYTDPKPDIALTCGVTYVLPGVTRIRFWAVCMPVWCAPGDSGPMCSKGCADDCPGPELPPIDFVYGDFTLAGEVLVPDEWYQPVMWGHAERGFGLIERLYGGNYN